MPVPQPTGPCKGSRTTNVSISRCRREQSPSQKAHTREWVQRVPIRVIVIHHNRARRDIRRSKVFHDVLYEKFETRCAIRRCKVQVSFLRSDLTTIISIEFRSTTTTKTHILQMQNKQPLLVHLIERRSHSEHTHQHKRRHAQEQYPTQQRPAPEPMCKGQHQREGLRAETADERGDHVVRGHLSAYATHLSTSHGE